LAGGRVQCGECGVRYDALKSLCDEGALSHPNVAPPPSAERVVTTRRTPAKIAVDRDLGRKVRFLAGMSKPGSDPPLGAVPPDVYPRGSRWWTGASILLFLILLFQVAWFNAREVALTLPVLQPALARICTALGCELLAPRHTLAVKILARDVREHPKLRSMLLVNLTLLNSAKATQPFPLLQLDLMDLTGQAVASRRFQPHEYLDASVNAEGGMPSEAPVHVVLEVAEPKKRVKGFEFHVL
ncbi:MAG: DUF3426 domain-containing protein, partial [Gammaproteobacteria bacterium]